MVLQIEPKPIITATQLSVGEPTQDHNNRVCVSYTLRDTNTLNCGQGTIEFEGEDAILALADTALAVAQSLGLTAIIGEKKKSSKKDKKDETAPVGSPSEQS